MDRLKTTQRRLADRTLSRGVSTYRLRRASRRICEACRTSSVRCSLSPPWRAVALAASGCGTSTADAARGRVLFVQKCGGCHTLAEAGTTAQIGPDLDDAFAAAREIGQDSDTIEGVVKAQVEYPRPSNGNPAVSMPADIVAGQDLDDVAAYVGEWAGVPGAAPPKVPGGPGAQVFANNGCGGCHTLAAAEPAGTPAPTSTKSSRARTRRKSKRTSSTRTKSSPRATRPT